MSRRQQERRGCAHARTNQSEICRRIGENGLAVFCGAHGIALLCYGTLAGGFIAERWLGALEPRPPFANRSLVKYQLIIDDFGGWRRFQALLAVLDAIAKRHHVSLANVAIRYVLDKPGVAVAIVGSRDAAHLDGLVRAVHAGFPSPGSGEYYARAEREVTELVERLLAEKESRQ